MINESVEGMKVESERDMAELRHMVEQGVGALEVHMKADTFSKQGVITHRQFLQLHLGRCQAAAC